MAEYQVNIAELQEICNYVINADYPYFEELREAFKLLRHTGCREMEIFEIQRWSQISGDEFTLTPQKGNNNRTIILGADFSNFKAAILGQYPPFLGRTYSQLQNLFKRVCPYWPIYSGTKQITLYIFRYLFLHELKADGLTNQQIADVMGHVNVDTVSNYLDAVLSSENEIPVVPTDPLPEGHIDVILEKEIFNGTSDYIIQQNPIINDKVSIFFDIDVENTSLGYVLSANYTQSHGVYIAINATFYTTYVTIVVSLYGRSLANYGRITQNYYSPYETIGVVTIDFSEIGTNGGTYRNSYFSLFHPLLPNISSSYLNKNINQPFSEEISIGARGLSGPSYTQFFKGSINKLIIWNRILDNEEIENLFLSI